MRQASAFPFSSVAGASAGATTPKDRTSPRSTTVRCSIAAIRSLASRHGQNRRPPSGDDSNRTTRSRTSQETAPTPSNLHRRGRRRPGDREGQSRAAPTVMGPPRGAGHPIRLALSLHQQPTLFSSASGVYSKGKPADEHFDRLIEDTARPVFERLRSEPSMKASSSPASSTAISP